MALTGIYNSSDREIVLNSAQANIFNQTIQYFKTNGVGGDNVFEDTYVLQKRVAEYIKENMGGVLTMNTQSAILQVYNGVLGISPATPPPPPPPPPPPSGGNGSNTTSDDVFTRDDRASDEGTTASTSGGTTTSTSGGTTASTSGGTTTSTSGAGPSGEFA
jgi:hypothetical protein